MCENNQLTAVCATNEETIATLHRLLKGAVMRLPDKRVYLKISFLISQPKLRWVFPKEASERDGSFGHLKHMFKLVDKETNRNFTLEKIHLTVLLTISLQITQFHADFVLADA